MSRTRRLLGLLAATMLAVAIVPLAASGTDGPLEPDPFELTEEAGTIELKTTADTVTITLTTIALDGTVASESLSDDTLDKQDKCVIDQDFSSVLGITIDGVVNGAPADLGLVSNGLGSSDGKNCNTSNGRVEDGQRLTLTLPDGLRADRATLDIEGKFGARLLASGELDGEPTLTTAPEGLSLAGEGASDNGADSGESDNTLLPIGTTGPGDDFDVLVLEPLSDDGRGEFALEGGGDFTGPVVSTIHLVRVVATYDYTLGCGEFISEDFAADGEDTQKAQSALLMRYDTEGKDGDCLPIGATVTSDGESILVDNTDTDAFGGGQSPNLRLTLTWRVSLYNGDDPRPTQDVWDELQREIDLTPLTTATGPVDVQYCLADRDDTAMKPALQPDPETNWCLLNETQTVEDGYLIQKQVYDGAGDPRFF